MITADEANMIADAVIARLKARAVEPLPDTLTCEQFAERLGRGVRWVQDRCRARRIKCVAGRRPYLIPVSELARILQ
jgi:hypothetical protein